MFDNNKKYTEDRYNIDQNNSRKSLQYMDG